MRRACRVKLLGVQQCPRSISWIDGTRFPASLGYLYSFSARAGRDIIICEVPMLS